MAKVHKNGNTIIRVSDIVLAHIPEDNSTIVEIGTKAGHCITIRNDSEIDALNYLDYLQRLIEGK